MRKAKINFFQESLIFLQILLCLFSISCSKLNREKIIDKKELTREDYRLFQNTPAWELAKAVQDENEKRVNEILAENPKLIDFQENRFGSTLLILTVRNQQYKSFEILLKNKADVNIHDTYEGSSALIEACSYNLYDTKFVETLLQNGANVNDTQVDIDKEGKTKTALMKAAQTGNLNLVKLLVEKKATLNYQNEYGQSALSESIMRDHYKVSFYLLQNGAEYKQPIFYRPGYSVPNSKKGQPVYLADFLREVFLDFGTDEYKYKMQIVDFLKSKGIDYRDIPIPDFIREKAQKKYPKNWEQYLEKY